MMEGCHPELQTATLPILKLVTLQPWKAWREHYTIRKGSCLHLSAVFCLKIQRSSKWKLLQVTELKQKGLLADGLATKHFIILGSDTHSVDTFSRKHMQKKKKEKKLVFISILENWEMLTWYIHWEVSLPCIKNHMMKYHLLKSMTVLSMSSEVLWLHQPHRYV